MYIVVNYCLKANFVLTSSLIESEKTNLTTRSGPNRPDMIVGTFATHEKVVYTNKSGQIVFELKFFLNR